MCTSPICVCARWPQTAIVVLPERPYARFVNHGAVHDHRARRIDAVASTDRRRLREAWRWCNRFVVLYSGSLGLAHEPGSRLGEVQKKPGGRSAKVARDSVWCEELQDVLVAGDVDLNNTHPRAVGLVVFSELCGIWPCAGQRITSDPRKTWFDIMTSARVSNADTEGLIAPSKRYRMDAASRVTDAVRARKVLKSNFTKWRGIEQFRVIMESL